MKVKKLKKSKPTTGNKSRNKGQRGEREVCELLSKELGIKLTRNLSQTREGGSDCIQVPGWSIEIKRCNKINVNAFWNQTVMQSIRENKKPILFFRENYKPWKACLLLNEVYTPITTIHDVAPNELMFVSLEAACMIIQDDLIHTWKPRQDIDFTNMDMTKNLAAFCEKNADLIPSVKEQIVPVLSLSDNEKEHLEEFCSAISEENKLIGNNVEPPNGFLINIEPPVIKINPEPPTEVGIGVKVDYPGKLLR